MTLPAIDTQYLLDILDGLLNTPSPTGYTQEAVAYIENALAAFPHLEHKRTLKGALLASWSGKSSQEPRAVAVHTDTLGAMVKQIKSNGRLQLTKIGGFAWNTVEGEGCTVFTQGGERIRGSLLIDKASGHVYGKKVIDTPREDEHMEVRLDARTLSESETRDLGVEVGDFVIFDPRVEMTNGFVRSRHLDDKACVACALAAVKAIGDAGLSPAQKAYLYFSNYEEVGHGGASGIPEDSAEMLVVDMAAVGDGQTSDEFHATLCVKDSSGPYHYDLNQRLRKLAEQHDIAYKVDIYPFYGSDGSAQWRAGGDLAVALIGPGVDASHNYERTHLEALEATTQWIMAYLLE
jgi:putative aminopeptidase FrvX